METGSWLTVSWAECGAMVNSAWLKFPPPPQILKHFWEFYPIHIMTRLLFSIQWNLSWETTAMRDHLSWQTTHFQQKGLHFKITEPVTRDHLSWQTTFLLPMGWVFQDRFYCTTWLLHHLSNPCFQSQRGRGLLPNSGHSRRWRLVRRSNPRSGQLRESLPNSEQDWWVWKGSWDNLITAGPTSRKISNFESVLIIAEPFFSKTFENVLLVSIDAKKKKEPQNDRSLKLIHKKSFGDLEW